jgi:hypothetical protein
MGDPPRDSAPSLLGRIVATLRALFTTGLGADPAEARRASPSAGGRYPDSAAFRDDVLERYPFTEEAKALLRTVRFEVKNLRQPVGGGGWYGPEARRIVLEGIQDEAAVHELAHAFWHYAREENDNAQAMIDAVVRLADETDPRYARAQQLAHHYVHGIPTQPDPDSPTGYWRGMLVDRNDWEMFAGLASGVMGDMRLLPPYVRRLYAGLFVGASEQDTIEA